MNKERHFDVSNYEGKIERAFITTITGFSYYKGLKVLVKTFKKTKSKYPLFVMIPATAEKTLKVAVKKLGVEIIECDQIQISSNAALANRVEHWNQTFFKLNIVRLTKFRKLVYIDADMIVLKNIDGLFDYPSISATTGGKAAHPEWVEFNSGLTFIEPDLKTFERLVDCIEPAIARRQSLGLGYGDQDVFNQFYSNWINELDHHFDEEYNAECCYLDALMTNRSYKDFSHIYVLHYIGAVKIWNNSLIKNLRVIRGCFYDKRPYEAKAYLLFLKNLYF